jgi:hypothetical protein
MRKYGIPILLIALFLLCAGCWPGSQVDSDKTPFQLAQEQVQKIMDAYIFVYDKTLALANDPDITASEKKVVAANKKVLDEVWPSLKRCLTVIGAGKIPSQVDLDTADDILDLIEGALQ